MERVGALTGIPPFGIPMERLDTSYKDFSATAGPQMQPVRNGAQ